VYAPWTMFVCESVATSDISECYLYNEPSDLSEKAECIEEVVVRTKEYEYCLDIDAHGEFATGLRNPIDTCLLSAACNNPDAAEVAKICSLLSEEGGDEYCGIGPPFACRTFSD